MFRHSMQIVVNAPIEKVFSYVADFSKRDEWHSDSIAFEKTSPGPVALGSTFTGWRYWAVARSRGRSSIQSVRTDVEMTQFVLNERLVWEGRRGAVRTRGFVEVKAADGGTRIMLSDETLPSPLVLLISPIIYFQYLITWPFTRWTQGRMAWRLKARLET